LRVLGPAETVLSAVSPACRHLLRVAAGLGPRPDPELVAEMIGQHTAALLPAWDEALASGILVSRDGELLFAQESLRHAVFESVPAALRRALMRPATQMPADAPVAPVAAASMAAVALAEPTPPDLPADRLPGRLTARERTVMALLARGHSNHQIARALGISDHAVKRHVSNLLMKFGCSNRTEIALLAVARYHMNPPAP
jgi:DNA-binding CsgD family transcriptional regulator